MKDHLSLKFGHGDKANSIWCCTSPTCLEVKGGLIESFIQYGLNHGVVEEWQYSLSTYQFQPPRRLETILEEILPEKEFKITYSEAMSPRTFVYELLDLEGIIPENDILFGYLSCAVYYESWEGIERKKIEGDPYDPSLVGQD